MVHSVYILKTTMIVSSVFCCPRLAVSVMSGALAMDGRSESRVLSLPLGGLLDFERWLETIRFFL